jgi:hypothetical protein
VRKQASQLRRDHARAPGGGDRLAERLAQSGLRAGVLDLAQRQHQVGCEIGEIEPLGDGQALERHGPRLLEPLERGQHPGMVGQRPGTDDVLAVGSEPDRLRGHLGGVLLRLRDHQQVTTDRQHA